MGCGASAQPKPVSPTEREELCLIGSKEMGLLCIQEALATRKDKVVVGAPECVSKYRAFVEKLRKEADEAASQEEKGDEAPKEGGGGILGKVAAVFDTAKDMASAAAGSAKSMVYRGLADTIEKPIESVEKSFASVGSDVLKEKETKILQIYTNTIEQYNFAEPVKLVRGQEPWDQAAYDSVPPDSVCKAITSEFARQPPAELSDDVKAALQNHTLTQVWGTLMKGIESTHEKASSLSDTLAQHLPKKPDLDLNKYVIDSMTAKLGEQMGAVEGDIRKNPAGKSRKPVTFGVVFSGQNMTKDTYAKKDT